MGEDEVMSNCNGIEGLLEVLLLQWPAFAM